MTMMNVSRDFLLLVGILLSLESISTVVSFGVQLRHHRCQYHPTTSTPLFASSSSSSSLPTVNNWPDQDTIDAVQNSIPNIVDQMPDPLPTDLRNQYFFLRHGQSTANVDQVISSSRSLAYTDRHGLTTVGYDQGVDSANRLIDVLESDTEDITEPEKRLVFVSSPFARAKQTAEACLDGLIRQKVDDTNTNNNNNLDRIKRLGLSVEEDIVLEDQLMERYFGKLDGEAIYTYAYVWPLDKFNTTHTAFDVESVAAVCHRWKDVIGRLEEQYDNCYLVLVSHADVLQIGQLYAANAENVGAFSSYRFQNGEVRPLKSDPTSLPPPVPLEPPERGTSQYVTSQQS